MVFLTVFLPVIFLAVIDSLNPAVLLIFSMYLLSDNQLKMAAIFMLGVFISSFLGSIVVVFGFYQIYQTLLMDNQRLLSAAFKTILGISCILLGIYKKRRTTKNKSHTLPQGILLNFALGFAVNSSDIITLAPFFAAMEKITSAQLTAGSILFVLIAYNVVVIAPMLTVVFFNMAKSKISAAILKKIQHHIDSEYHNVLFAMCLLIGIYLLTESAILMFTNFD